MVIRHYRDEDSSPISAFRCAHHGRDWECLPERVIREAPSQLAVDRYLRIIVADHCDDGLVGVIVYGIGQHGAVAGMHVVFALGVAIPWQHQRIGMDLKRTALRAVRVSGDEGSEFVLSEVHRRNYQMIGLNEKLGAKTVFNPLDREFLFSGVLTDHEI